MALTLPALSPEPERCLSADSIDPFEQRDKRFASSEAQRLMSVYERRVLRHAPGALCPEAVEETVGNSPRCPAPSSRSASACRMIAVGTRKVGIKLNG